MAISLINHDELHDKFVVEIMRLLHWCDDSYVLVKEETPTEQELLETLKKGPCPLILPINQIMLPIQREPVLKDRLLFEIGHAIRAACIATEEAEQWTKSRVQDHYVWLENMDVAQGVISPDRDKVPPYYAKYNDLPQPKQILRKTYSVSSTV